MKRLFLLLALCISINSVCAYTTDASKFAEEQYSKEFDNCEAKIQVVKEYTNEYQQQIGEKIVPAITYGYGYMRAKDRKKCRITYICLLDDNCQPFWSCILSYK